MILTSLVCVLAVTAACGKKQSTQYSEYVTDDKGQYVTDKQGNIETTILDSKNVSVEYVTDDKGKKQIDEKGEYVTVVHVVKDVTVTDKNGKTLTSKQDTANTTASIGDEQGQTNAATQTTAKQGKTTKTGERLFENKVLPILKSGRFTMKMTYTGNMEGSGNVSMPVVIAYNTPQNKFFMETKMGVTKLQCIIKNSKMYLIIPSMKSYSETDYGDGDGDMAEALKGITDEISSSSAKYVKTTNTKVNNVECICEEYKDETALYRYFFAKSDKKFIRMELIDSESGQSTIIIVDSLTAGADDSYFEIPKGYKEIDLESLAGSLGMS